MRKIALGSDHAGFRLKNAILKHLEEKGIDCFDFGTHDEESIDYVRYGEKVGLAVTSDEYDLGILVCGTGVGISIAANKVSGVRAAVCSDIFTTVMSRKHNDANILALGARTLGEGLALMLVDAFLETEHEGGRHQDRVQMIHKLEDKCRRCMGRYASEAESNPQLIEKYR